jgi:hypothetical protein
MFAQDVMDYYILYTVCCGIYIKACKDIWPMKMSSFKMLSLENFVQI